MPDADEEVDREPSLLLFYSQRPLLLVARRSSNHPGNHPGPRQANLAKVNGVAAVVGLCKLGRSRKPNDSQRWCVRKASWGMFESSIQCLLDSSLAR